MDFEYSNKDGIKESDDGWSSQLDEETNQEKIENKS